MRSASTASIWRSSAFCDARCPRWKAETTMARRSRMQPACQRVAHAADGIKAPKPYSLEDEAEAPLAGRDGIPTPAPMHRHLGLRIFGERGAGPPAVCGHAG